MGISSEKHGIRSMERMEYRDVCEPWKTEHGLPNNSDISREHFSSIRLCFSEGFLGCHVEQRCEAYVLI